MDQQKDDTVTVSGKLFQLNINSAVSFQLRAGFASASPGGSPSANRLTPRQEEEDSEPKRYEEAAYYEVVDVSEEPSAETYSAMIGLPASTIENQALPPAQSSYKPDLTAKIQHTETENYRRYADERAYVQSYNRNGHRMLTFLQTPTVDLVV